MQVLGGQCNSAAAGAYGDPNGRPRGQVTPEDILPAGVTAHQIGRIRAEGDVPSVPGDRGIPADVVFLPSRRTHGGSLVTLEDAIHSASNPHDFGLRLEQAGVRIPA
jgi:hypothetical protein